MIVVDGVKIFNNLDIIDKSSLDKLEYFAGQGADCLFYIAVKGNDNSIYFFNLNIEQEATAIKIVKLLKNERHEDKF